MTNSVLYFIVYDDHLFDRKVMWNKDTLPKQW